MLPPYSLASELFVTLFHCERGVRAAGTSVRFEPGEAKMVALVAIAGRQVISGGNNAFSGAVLAPPGDLGSPEVEQKLSETIERLVAEGFQHSPNYALSAGSEHKAKKSRNDVSYCKVIENFSGVPVPRVLYCRMYGPTVGDVVRLGDTALLIRVEKDLTVYGDECKFGGRCYS